MKLGIFARVFHRASLDEVLVCIREHGLTAVQFNLSCAGLDSLPEVLEPSVCLKIHFRFRALRFGNGGHFRHVQCDPSGFRRANRGDSALPPAHSACRTSGNYDSQPLYGYSRPVRSVAISFRQLAARRMARFACHARSLVAGCAGKRHCPWHRAGSDQRD